MELSALPVLAELAGDRRAAWVWSADGSRILWTNAAGAAFFSVREVASLARLDGLARSPARPHIARIATSGSTDKPSIDRLRFYRGLRVLLLTCQCQRLQLDNGHDAALVICTDKGLALTEAALPAFAALLAGHGRTAVLQDAAGAVTERRGDLAGTPEFLDLPDGQRILSGPLEVDGTLHESTVVLIGDASRLVLLTDDALQLDEPETGTDVEDPSALETRPQILTVDEVGTAALAELAPEEAIAPLSASLSKEDTGRKWARAEDLDEADVDSAPGPSAEAVSDPTSETEAIEEDAAQALAPQKEQTGFETNDADDQPQQEQPEEAADGFRFVARRRPVRFAWKMDIDQRFTFISDEFIDTLGPDASDIVGKTWAEVSKTFDLDVTGSIARSLDRRDTWSGKTVDWPVTGRTLRVPVDMAALPAFDRERQFEGYRGFGVCRTADAVEDPLAPLPPLIAEAAKSSNLHVDETAAALQPEALAETDAPTAEVAAAAALPLLKTPETPFEEAPAETGSANLVEPAATPEADVPTVSEGTADRDTVPGEVDEDLHAVSAPAPEATAEPETVVEPQEPEKQTGTSAFQEPLPTIEDVAELLIETMPEPEVSEAVADDVEETAPPAEAEGTFEPEVHSSELTTALPEEEELEDQPEPIETVAEEPEQAVELTEAEQDAAFETGEDESAQDEQAAETAEPEAEAIVEAEPEPKPFVQPDLTPQPKQPLAGGTLIGASAAALLNGLSLKSSRPATPAEPGREQDLFPRDEAAPSAGMQPKDPAQPANATPEKAATSAPPVPERDQEPAGISGSAPLHPAEIETAVRTLAKNYGRKPQESLPLTPPAQPVEKVSAEQDPSPADARDAGTETDQAMPSLAKAETQTGNDNLRHDNDARKADAPEENSETLKDGPDEPEATPLQADAQPDSATETPDAEDGTSKVIHLIGRRPQVVPVDTSRLSRPERAAFRKIAEALGARLEGDMEEGRNDDEEQDLALEQELARFNAPPQAGPIDPRLLDRLPIGIAIARDRDVLYANDTLLAMLGYKSLGALADAGGLEAVFVEDDDSFPDAEGMEGTVDDTLKVRLAGGGLRAVDARMHSVPWNGGSGLMISITERPVPAAPAAAPVDATALKKAQDQVAELDTILETATDGVLVLDRHGTITKVNRSAEALFSANRVDMEGAPLTEFLAPESHRSAADYLDGLMRNGVASILNDGREVLGRVSSGGLIPLFMTVGRISGNGGDPKFCAVLRDITQWKTAEEELTHAKRQAENASSQKSDFLAKISHEIRTPLNAIIGFSEVMIEERFGTIGNDRYKEYLKDIRTSGSHIMSLVNDLLDLSKIEAGKMDLRFSAVSPNEVMSECVALMQPQANRERVIIRASLPDSVPSIVVDQRSLRQIMLNLLSNAIKFNKSGGQVIISSALEDTGEVILRVRDTGTGMSPQDLSAALEPFRQVHTARYGGGTGLGLPLTKALVEANRASFRIDSTPDQGTLVEIRFPSQRVLAE
ncbi:ATP-binding protein [Roseibium litorale]|uniref:histidine kinase n=1 Tax=Roseibium litorale TaxID=2803841 RepID=A0ABR9CPV8_9HYPH|nr:ATP-binding protein [Roseibium litorale]MBD8892894.1 PAS domain S-box protein [Roseibium litorale]